MVRTLLDLDLYKLTMMQFVYYYYSDTVVKFKFNNRTDINLPNYIDVNRLKIELNKVKNLRFKKGDIEYLRSLGYFKGEFLDYLVNYKLPDIDVSVENNWFNITSTAQWKDVILWETFVLSTVNELYYYSKYSKNDCVAAEDEGHARLLEKLDRLRTAGVTGITDFGTRRRFSQKWHEEVIREVRNHPSFVGTSNVYLAKKYNLKPVGTNAHELYMVSAGINANDETLLKNSHSKIMNEWHEMYGYDLSIGLTDTFGTNFFFDDFKDKAHLWKGLRQDSGIPIHFGEKAINFYKSLNIDPVDKLVVFSDGLNVDSIIDLYKRFLNRISTSFGWGTKLTNDLGFETLSIVMKAVEVISHNGVELNNSLVKLSDNTNKNLGTQENLKLYKRVFNYINAYKEDLEV
jgi:nicotinate phosphoribosyltransferase